VPVRRTGAYRHKKYLFAPIDRVPFSVNAPLTGTFSSLNN